MRVKRIWFRDSRWLNRPLAGSDKVLDIGAGGRRRAPHVETMDIRNMGDTDIVHDADVCPWPFDDNRFDYIILGNVLEHVIDIGAVLNEIRRVGKNGATVRIICPHFSNPCSYVDVTHKHALSVLSLDVFCFPVAERPGRLLPLFKKVLGCNMSVADAFRENKFALVRRSLGFREAVWWTLAPIWGNLFQEFYEVYLRNLIPAWDIYWELRVAKDP